jgi:phosphoribosylanthranilate isomerase
MKIKICGLFRYEDIEAVNDAFPDYAGFVFAESRRKLSPQKAREFRRILRREINAVGVFVNAAMEDIERVVMDGIIDTVQLHGSEDEGYIGKLKTGCGVKIIKAIRVAGKEDIAAWENSAADFLLLDGGAGDGRQFDWGLIGRMGRMKKPFFLAGGINPENLNAAVCLNPYCVDISSGAETGGFKDRGKIFALVKGVKHE